MMPGEKREIYSVYEPAWRLSYAIPMWLKGFTDAGYLLTAKDFLQNAPYAEIGYVSEEELSSVLSVVVPRVMAENNLQPIIDIAKKYRCFEDFDYRSSRQKTDFYRQWYHTRIKHPLISLECFMEDYAESHDGEEWEIHDDALESGTVNVSGNADVYIAVDEESIEADVVTVDGGSLKAHGGNGYSGIYVAEVTVNAGKLIVSSEDENAILADSIKITGGTLVAGNNTAEYSVFDVAPDFSEYNSEHMVLASEKADATYLVEYDSANAENYRVITIQCKHELDGKVCKKCGFECGVDCGHYLEEGAVCAICGSFVYAITHQPTEAEPYVGLSDETDASYQWYTVEENTSEITDENAGIVSYTWGESSYDKETGWTGVPNAEGSLYQDFFTAELKAGETVTVELTGDFSNIVVLYNYDSAVGVGNTFQEGVATYEFTVESAGNYTFYTYVNSGVVTVKAHKTTVDENTIDGETSAELKKPVIGNKHFCEVTFADGTTEISDAFEATHLHSFSKYEVTEEAECGKAGKEVANCDHDCGATDEKEIPALTHKDEDGDYLCDYGCGHEFPKPIEPEQPDTPTADTCDHLCHKIGFMGFIWKIIKFFFKLFGIQQYCDCGTLHY